MRRSSSERRRAPRVDEQLPLTLGIPEREVAASSRNLSSSGVYCELNRDVPLMTQVALTIALPRQRIQCRGVVVRSDVIRAGSPAATRYRIAVFFTEIRPRDRQAIARFVAERLAAAGHATVRRASTPDGPSRHASLNSVALLGLVVMGLTGCQTTQWSVVRGGRAKAVVDILSHDAQDDATYTLRWLRRAWVDDETYVRFDGVIIDVQGRSMEVHRQQAGHHVIVLRAVRAPALPSTTPPSPAPRRQTLSIPAKELAVLQAVVQRQHFAPYVVTSPSGSLEAVIYAPVPTIVTAAPSHGHDGIRLDIRRRAGKQGGITDAGALTVFSGQGP